MWKALEARKRKPTPRVPTRPTSAARERRLDSKRRTGEKKRVRREPGED
jgi:ribosome-associated protein